MPSGLQATGVSHTEAHGGNLASATLTCLRSLYSGGTGRRAPLARCQRRPRCTRCREAAPAPTGQGRQAGGRGEGSRLS